MEQSALQELYVDELKDIYSAETQMLRALPKMANAATSEELRSDFEDHLEQTKVHVQRLEQIFQTLGEKPTGKKCKGMEGLISEGQEVMEEDFESDVMDAALISAAQRVEHYEIAAYGTMRTYAQILGDKEAVGLLEQTLEEEKETDQKLTDLAGDINIRAAGDAGQESSQKQPSDTKSRSAKA
jgi:ferritin-like metal-binding protein YciE